MSPLPASLLDALASAAVREGLADAVFTRLRTPIGRLLIVQGAAGICRIGFEEEPEDHALAGVAARLGPRIVASDAELATVRDALEAYFEGEAEGLAGLPVDLSLVASPFRREVLETLRPRGRARRHDRLRGAGGTRRPAAGGARGGHRDGAQPGADRRPLPPSAPRLGGARQLWRGSRAQAGPAHARRRYDSRISILSMTTGSVGRSSGPTGTAPIASATSRPLVTLPSSA